MVSLNINASESLFIFGCFMVFICVFGFIAYLLLNGFFQVLNLDYKEVLKIHGCSLKSFLASGSINGVILKGFRFKIDIYEKFFVLSVFNHAVIIDNYTLITFVKGIFNSVKIRKYNDKINLSLPKKELEFLENWCKANLERENKIEGVI